MWWTSLGWGTAVAIVIAAAMTGWGWVENTHGRFRGQEGTHWHFVLETALDWLIPVFCYATVGAFLVQLVRAGIRRLWARKGW